MLIIEELPGFDPREYGFTDALEAILFALRRDDAVNLPLTAAHAAVIAKLGTSSWPAQSQLMMNEIRRLMHQVDESLSKALEARGHTKTALYTHLRTFNTSKPVESRFSSRFNITVRLGDSVPIDQQMYMTAQAERNTNRFMRVSLYHAALQGALSGMADDSQYG